MPDQAPPPTDTTLLGGAVPGPVVPDGSVDTGSPRALAHRHRHTPFRPLWAMVDASWPARYPSSHRDSPTAYSGVQQGVARLAGEAVEVNLAALVDVRVVGHPHHLTGVGGEEALDRVERAQVQVNNKRAREAQKAQDAAAQLIAETQAAAIPVQAETAPGPAAMEVDSGAPAEAGAKRKAEDEGTPEPTKKARVGE